MFTHSMLKLCFNFIVGIILLTPRMNANPLNRFVVALARGTETTEANNT